MTLCMQRGLEWHGWGTVWLKNSTKETVHCAGMQQEYTQFDGTGWTMFGSMKYSIYISHIYKGQRGLEWQGSGT